MDKWNNPQSKPYKPYEGINKRIMPKLIAEGRNPISPSLLFWRKLETLNEHLRAFKEKNKELAEAWRIRTDAYWDNEVVTGFGVARHPDKGVILVPDVQYLRELNPQTISSLDIYATLPNGMFEQLKGHAYSAEEVKRYGNKWLTQEEVLSSPFWQDLIPNKDLRNSSIVNIFYYYRQRFEHNMPRFTTDRHMGVFFPDVLLHEPIMGLFSIGSHGRDSHADGKYDLNGGGRLVGVLPNVAEGDVRKLEYIVQYSQVA